MGSLLLQTPVPLAGMQFYGTIGGGGCRERLGEEPDARQETSVSISTGGGVKISLLGPIRVRLDYRLFKLQGNPLYSSVHRIYAGFNLAF